VRVIGLASAVAVGVSLSLAACSSTTGSEAVVDAARHDAQHDGGVVAAYGPPVFHDSGVDAPKAKTDAGHHDGGIVAAYGPPVFLDSGSDTSPPQGHDGGIVTAYGPPPGDAGA